jgi:hypothetical protein
LDIQGSPSKGYLLLPPPKALARESDLTNVSGLVAAARSAEEAHYRLVGRLNGDYLEYAWLKREESKQAGEESGLSGLMPQLSMWRALEPNESKAGDSLRRDLLALATNRAWLTLEGSPTDDLPKLAVGLRDVESRQLFTGAQLDDLAADRWYRPVLLRPQGMFSTTWVYLMHLAPSGERRLAWPIDPARQYIDKDVDAPDELDIMDEKGKDFRLKPECDADGCSAGAFLLIVSSSKLKDLSLLSGEPVSGSRAWRPKGKWGPLDALLFERSVGVTPRGSVPSWSLRREVYRSRLSGAE